MNERIRELAEQAHMYARDYVEECKHYGYHMEHNEFELRFRSKFAELIIKECASLTLDYGGPDHYTGWLDYRDEIKKHFGIEE